MAVSAISVLHRIAPLPASSHRSPTVAKLAAALEADVACAESRDDGLEGARGDGNAPVAGLWVGLVAGVEQGTEHAA